MNNLTNIEIKQKINKLIIDFSIKIEDELNKKIKQSSKTRRETLIQIYTNLQSQTQSQSINEPTILEKNITSINEVVIINPDNNNETLIEKIKNNETLIEKITNNNLDLKEMKYKITIYKNDIRELRVENQTKLQTINDYKYKIKNYKIEIKKLYKRLKNKDLIFSSDSDSNNKNTDNEIIKISYSEIKKLRDNKINKKLIEKGFKYEEFSKLSYHEKKQLFNKNNNNKINRLFDQ